MEIGVGSLLIALYTYGIMAVSKRKNVKIKQRRKHY